jgi:hypothetical protein
MLCSEHPFYHGNYWQTDWPSTLSSRITSNDSFPKFIICYNFQSGVNPQDVGIIAPYRNQVLFIKKMLESLSCLSDLIEVNTVDQYQGRDKEVIIISYVRSQKANENVSYSCASLQDWTPKGYSRTGLLSPLILIPSQICFPCHAKEVANHSPWNKTHLPEINKPQARISGVEISICSPNRVNTYLYH